MSTNTATRSRLAAAVPQFSVSDVLATVHYYRDRLGFAVGDLVADPPEWGAVGRDDVESFSTAYCSVAAISTLLESSGMPAQRGERTTPTWSTRTSWR